jgi:hypothetical protein
MSAVSRNASSPLLLPSTEAEKMRSRVLVLERSIAAVVNTCGELEARLTALEVDNQYVFGAGAGASASASASASGLF